MGLRTAEWANTTIAAGDTAEEIDKLRRGDDGHIVVWGGVSLWRSLMQLDLIDEFRLDLYPYVAGEGTRLFDDVPQSYRLDLVSSTSFSNGTVGLHDPGTAEPAADMHDEWQPGERRDLSEGPWPNSNQPTIPAASPRSTAASRHRRSTSKPTTPRGAASTALLVEDEWMEQGRNGERVNRAWPWLVHLAARGWRQHSESRSFRACFGSSPAALRVRAPPAWRWRPSVFSKNRPGAGWACRTGRAIPD
jgi:hypothetical protein